MKHDKTQHPENGTPRDHAALRRQEWLAHIMGRRHGRRRLRLIAGSAAAIRLVTKKH